MAVFFTPAIISGTAKMKLSQFAVWNLFASILFTLSVTATAYGLGRVATGHHSTTDIVILLFGLTLSTVLTEGLTKKEAVRCLKRYVAREVYGLLPHEKLDLTTHRSIELGHAQSVFDVRCRPAKRPLSPRSRHFKRVKRRLVAIAVAARQDRC
jgi:hypothetical protein